MIENPDQAVPEGLRAAVLSGDFDHALAWLTDNRWPKTLEFDALVETVIDVFLDVEPKAAGSLLDRHLENCSVEPPPLDLFVRRIDAACRSGDSKHARATWDLVGPLVAAIRDREERHTRLLNLGAFFENSGDLEIARSILEPVIVERRSDPVGSDSSGRLTAAVLVNLATVEFHPACRNFSRGLALLAEAASVTEHTTTLGNIAFNRGFALAQVGDIAGAELEYELAAELFGSAGAEPNDVAFVRRAQAALLGRVGRVDEAQVLYEEAIEAFLHAGAFGEAARTDIGLLMATAASGKPMSQERIETARERVAAAAPASFAELLMNIANIEANKDDLKAACATLEEAHTRFEGDERFLDAHRAELSRAVMLRRLGDPQGALEIATRARDAFVEAGAAQLLAHADHNLALIYSNLGDRKRAVDSILAAVCELDRRRHELPSAHDRLATAQVTYPRLFEAALDIALPDDELCAALIERSRVQPIPRPDDAGRLRFRPPPAVAARPGSRPVPGDEPVRHLVSSLPQHLEKGHRLSWAVLGDDLLRCHLTRDRTVVDRVPLERALLDQLALMYASPTEHELRIASDIATARRAAMYRAASGWLFADLSLAERFGRTIPPSVRRSIELSDREDAGDVLRQLTRLLLPESLLAELRGSDGADAVLQLAPPALLGQIPWAALPVDNRCLAETALVELRLPVALDDVMTSSRDAVRGDTAVWVADPTGDLPFCRSVPQPPWTVLTASTTPRADADAVQAALRTPRDVLVYRGHIEPGLPTDPASSRLLLSEGSSIRADDLLAEANAPQLCLLLGCDASGASTGDEWTGVATGFVWAGASDVITTQWPVISGSDQERLDLELVDDCLRLGASAGLAAWQRRHARAWRSDPHSAFAPYRWANPVLVRGSRRTDIGDGDRFQILDRRFERLADAVGEEQRAVQDRLE